MRDQRLRIGHRLLHSGLEAQLLQQDLQDWLGHRTRVSARAQQNRQLHAQRALRCNIGRLLLGEDFRGLAARLADCPLFQFLCGLSAVDCITVPSQSTLQRYDQWWSETQVRQALQQLLGQAAQQPQSLQLPEPVDLESAFLDTTCLAANTHCPVDWVLLRDATRTLMRAVELIRGQGLKHRMEEPANFYRRINTLCIQMTHAGRHPDSQRQRKRTLRQMDRVVGTVGDHARRYRALLAERWPQTDWTQAHAQQVLRRMDGVLAQLPQARRQARQRILTGQPVAADRGFDNAVNQLGLAQKRIYNGVCPRSPQQLRQRLGGWKFRRLQRRRAQTEGRIGIFKQVFGAGHLRSKGFAHRQLTVSRAVLVHDLWVLARMQRAAAASVSDQLAA